MKNITHKLNIVVTSWLLTLAVFASGCGQVDGGLMMHGEGGEGGGKGSEIVKKETPGTEMSAEATSQDKKEGTPFDYNGSPVMMPSENVQLASIRKAMSDHKEVTLASELLLTKNERGPFNTIKIPNIPGIGDVVVSTMEAEDAKLVQKEIFDVKGCMTGYGKGNLIPGYANRKLNSSLGRRKNQKSRHTSIVAKVKQQVLLWAIAGGGGHYDKEKDYPLRGGSEFAWRPAKGLLDQCKDDKGVLNQGQLHNRCSAILAPIFFKFLPALYSDKYTLPGEPSDPSFKGPEFRGVYATEPPADKEKVFSFSTMLQQRLGFVNCGQIRDGARDLLILNMPQVCRILDSMKEKAKEEGKGKTTTVKKENA